MVALLLARLGLDKAVFRQVIWGLHWLMMTQAGSDCTSMIQTSACKMPP